MTTFLAYAGNATTNFIEEWNSRNKLTNKYMEEIKAKIEVGNQLMSDRIIIGKLRQLSAVCSKLSGSVANRVIDYIDRDDSLIIPLAKAAEDLASEIREIAENSDKFNQ